MRERWLRWLQRTAGTHKAGQLQPPGAAELFDQQQADGLRLALVARGDAFELYIGHQRDGAVTGYTVELPTVAKLARWLVWWWCWRAACGLRTRLWTWATVRVAELEAERRVKSTVVDFVRAKEWRK